MDKNSLLNFEGSQQFSVSEISNKIKYLLENNLGYVKIKGEISGYKLATSGHAYFNLKDESSIIAATCWRHSLAKVQFPIQEGMEVVVTGKVTAYPGQSKYQISADKIEPAGIGAFMQILKERKERLAKEGLFDPSHKKPLPFFPKVIGIITSPTGAVIRDIIHRIRDRCPVRLIIWPVTVQGETAAGEVSSAIDGFNKIVDTTKPDLLIVARGGGSIEDLWAFNEEVVIRSVYNSGIPVISAVGHETDYTLIDLVADKRAPTPTAAAEFAVPVILDLRYTINSLFNTVNFKALQQLKYYTQLLQGHNRVLLQPFNYLNNYIQRIDELSFRLNGALPNMLKIKQQTLNYLPISRLVPQKSMSIKTIKFTNQATNLLARKNNLLDIHTNKLKINSSLLDSMDYKKVLQRGFAMAKDVDGNFLSNVEQIKKTKQINLIMHDGEINLYKDQIFNK